MPAQRVGTECEVAVAQRGGVAHYRELRLLRISSAYQSLPWLVREHTNPDIGFEILTQRVTTLRHDLSDLGVLA